MELSSSAFWPGSPLASRHSWVGEDLSPPLDPRAVPGDEVSLALIVDVPDAPAGTFTRWLAWGIDSDTGRLAEGERAPGQGGKDFGEVGYRGPCPLRGHGAHQYFFRLYALARSWRCLSGDSRRDLERVSDGRGLAVSELVGTYRR
jgi:Raf kinase inhibitor-like YbhB/YbcL family protein